MRKLICMTLAASMLMSTAVQADQVISRKRKYVNSSDSTALQAEQYPVQSLTIEQALEKAIAYSPTLKMLDENTITSKLNLKDVTFTFRLEGDEITNNTLSVQINSLLTAIKNYDASKDITKQTLEYNITQLFYSEKDCEDNLALYEQSIDLMERSLKISALKLKLGMMSQTDYDSEVKDYEVAKSNKQKLDNAIKSINNSLNQVMGTDLNQTYNFVLDNVEYKAVGEIDTQKQVNYVLANSQTLKTAADTVSIKKYSLDKYSAAYSTKNREDVLFDYTQAARDYEDKKTSVSVAVKDLCDGIQESEQSYTDNQTKLNYLYSQREIMAKQLELGKITQLTYDQFEYQITQLEASMKSLARSHDLQVKKLNNPNLIA